VPGRVKAELAEVIESYLNAERPLALAVLLVDSRHEPTDLDLWMSGCLEERQLPVHVVSTKVDKLTRSRRHAAIESIRRCLGRDPVLPFSSTTGEGKSELWQVIDHRIETRTKTPPASQERNPR
jgi:GTP-binding protein